MNHQDPHIQLQVARLERKQQDGKGGAFPQVVLEVAGQNFHVKFIDFGAVKLCVFSQHVNWQFKKLLIGHEIILALLKGNSSVHCAPPFVGLLRDKHLQIAYENCANSLGAVSVP